MHIHSVILTLHIVSGSLALLFGIIALISKKGQSVHQKVGKMFYWSMLAVAASSFVLAGINFNPFLLSIGIFTLYMVSRGRRYIFYSRVTSPYIYQLTDKWPVYAGLLTAIFMMIFPFYYQIYHERSNIFVLAIFGLILFLNARADFRILQSQQPVAPGDKRWILKHIGMMTGAYIATTTAFLVNTVHIEPSWILWLAPTAIGVPYIFISIRRWRLK